MKELINLFSAFWWWNTWCGNLAKSRSGFGEHPEADFRGQSWYSDLVHCLCFDWFWGRGLSSGLPGMHWRNKTMEVGPGHGVNYEIYLNFEKKILNIVKSVFDWYSRSRKLIQAIWRMFKKLNKIFAAWFEDIHTWLK